MTAEQSPQTRGSSTTRAQFGHQRPAESCCLGGVGISSGISDKRLAGGAMAVKRSLLLEFCQHVVAFDFVLVDWHPGARLMLGNTGLYVESPGVPGADDLAVFDDA